MNTRHSIVSGSSRWWAAMMTVILALLLVSNALGQTVEAFDPNANSPVNTVVLQPDGKILLGGYFATIGGQARNRVARLQTDGTLDTVFNPTGWNPNGFFAFALAVQPDGGVLVGAQGGVLARLNPITGARDTSFNAGTNGDTYALVVQADGKILVGGGFSYVTGGVPRNGIARFNPNGTLDTGFDPNVNGVDSIAVQPDGKILVGGPFTSAGGVARQCLVRFNADGTLDAAFNVNVSSFSVISAQAITVQPDGKILVGGTFTSIGGVTRNYIARLNANGTLDTAFNPNANGGVRAITLQTDGKILVGGDFTNIGGAARTYLARLNADGTVDPSFNVNIGPAPRYVNALAVQNDGRIVIGGGFTSVGGQTRNYIARLTDTGPASQTLSATVSTITWSRGGTSPEVDHVTFEYSTDGVNYTSLGAALRIGATSHWQLTGLALAPGNLYLRARGYQMSSGAYGDGSSYEAVQLVNIVMPNTPPTITAGATATRQQSGAGAPHTIATVYDAETPLANLAVTVMSAPAGITISSISAPDATTGAVTATIAADCTATLGSNTVALKVTDSGGLTATADLIINVTPAPLPTIAASGPTTLCQGGSVTLTASPANSYLWSNGATTQSITVNASGSYSVTVTNANGCSASSAATTVTVNPATAIDAQPASLTRNAGQSATFSVTASGANLTYQWSKNGSAISGATASSYTIASVTTGDAGNYEVAVGGLCGDLSSNIAVLTVSGGCGTPVVSLTAPASGAIYAVGTPVNFAGVFTDTGGQPHTANWNFASNLVNANQSGAVNETAGTTGTSYTFAQAGVYLVTLTVANNCGNSASADTIGVDQLSALVVVYDPSAGHVSGGGWITSPPGAYVPSPTLTGKANFGFISKYKNGASVPDGNTEFQFKAGNMNFKSTVYEWLVIAGARAQYKGSGTINNAGDYRFMLTAIDGEQPGGGGLDKFRIKIWNNAGGGLVYDNQMNAPDSADPTTVLGGGQIVIHTGGSGANLAAQSAQTVNGDGQTSEAEVEWQIVLGAEGEQQSVLWGTSQAPYFDVIAPGDYDGDGVTDLGVFRRANGQWLIQRSTDCRVIEMQWGLGSDLPVAADYDGDGKTDIAVWRGATGQWFILRSSDGKTQVMVWGAARFGDLPAPADYDGDGKADVAVWRAAAGKWYALGSAGVIIKTRAAPETVQK